MPLGGSAPFTVTLHNNGPDPAFGVSTRLSIQSNDDPPPTISGTSSPVEQGDRFITWNAGTIAVGASVSITVTISASSTVVDSAVS